MSKKTSLFTAEPGYIILRETYTDKITGFSGIADVQVIDLTGHVRVSLQKRVGDDGKVPPAEFFSVERLTGKRSETPPKEEGLPLGETYKDRVTGYEGVAIGRVDYLTGCRHIALQARVDKDGKIPDQQYFDESRLDERVEKPGGPPMQTPRRIHY